MPGRAATSPAPKPAPRAEPSRASPSSSRRSTRPPSAAPAGPSTSPHYAPAPDRKHAHTTPPPRWQQHPTTAPAAVHLITRSAVIMQYRPGRRTASPEAMGFLVQSVLGHICNSLTCGYLFPVMGQVRNVAGHSHGGPSPSRTCPYVHAERRHSGRQASDRCPYRFAGTQNSRGRHGVLRRLKGQPWLRTGPGSAALHLVHHDQYRAALHRCLPVAEDGEKHPQH